MSTLIIPIGSPIVQVVPILCLKALYDYDRFKQASSPNQFRKKKKKKKKTKPSGGKKKISWFRFGAKFQLILSPTHCPLL